MLVRMPATISIADFVGQVKGASAHLATHDIQPGDFFKWQGGYGAFSVSLDDLESVSDYIARQAERHATGGLVAAWEPEVYLADDQRRAGGGGTVGGGAVGGGTVGGSGAGGGMGRRVNPRLDGAARREARLRGLRTGEDLARFDGSVGAGQPAQAGFAAGGHPGAASGAGPAPAGQVVRSSQTQGATHTPRG